MDEIKELYFGNATLFLNKDDKDEFEQKKPDFLKFLEEDQRYTLKDINSPINKAKRMMKYLVQVRDKRIE